MKRLYAIIISAVMVLSVCACGNSNTVTTKAEKSDIEYLIGDWNGPIAISIDGSGDYHNIYSFKSDGTFEYTNKLNEEIKNKASGTFILEDNLIKISYEKMDHDSNTLYRTIPYSIKDGKAELDFENASVKEEQNVVSEIQNMADEITAQVKELTPLGIAGGILLKQTNGNPPFNKDIDPSHCSAEYDKLEGDGDYVNVYGHGTLCDSKGFSCSKYSDGSGGSAYTFMIRINTKEGKIEDMQIE